MWIILTFEKLKAFFADLLMSRSISQFTLITFVLNFGT